MAPSNGKRIGLALIHIPCFGQCRYITVDELKEALQKDHSFDAGDVETILAEVDTDNVSPTCKLLRNDAISVSSRDKFWTLPLTLWWSLYRMARLIIMSSVP